MLVLLSLIAASLALGCVARSLRAPDRPVQPWPYFQDERWLVQRWLLERDRIERERRD
jgi:hypothetical protein